jgi:hypothetical protein
MVSFLRAFSVWVAFMGILDDNPRTIALSIAALGMSLLIPPKKETRK